MTLRLCFLGNSHIAALREAWRKTPDRWPDVEARFVGAHKDLLLKTTHRAGRLVPTGNATADAFRKLGGVEDLTLADYDAFVITGCLVSVASAANTYRDCRWIGLPSLEAKPDLAAGPEGLLSYAAARATIQAALAARLGPVFAAHLRDMTDKPILLSSQPRVSASVKTALRASIRAHHVALDNGDAKGLSAIFEDAAACATEAAGAQYVPQPRHTIEDHILTSRTFMAGAKRLTPMGKAAQPKDDIMHANAAYGTLVIDQVIDRLRG